MLRCLQHRSGAPRLGPGTSLQRAVSCVSTTGSWLQTAVRRNLISALSTPALTQTLRAPSSLGAPFAICNPALPPSCWHPLVLAHTGSKTGGHGRRAPEGRALRGLGGGRQGTPPAGPSAARGLRGGSPRGGSPRCPPPCGSAARRGCGGQCGAATGPAAAPRLPWRSHHHHLHHHHHHHNQPPDSRRRRDKAR